MLPANGRRLAIGTLGRKSKVVKPLRRDLIERGGSNEVWYSAEVVSLPGLIA
jgi:hypothetical protein